jgi:CubicO group peptidase (beta-lactamase class C family)
MWTGRPSGYRYYPTLRTPTAELGYGLGLGVLVDAVAARTLATEGSYGWAGAANTFFWVDPKEQLTYMFLTQLLAYGEYSIDKRLSQLVYQAIVDDAP